MKRIEWKMVALGLLWQYKWGFPERAPQPEHPFQEISGHYSFNGKKRIIENSKSPLQKKTNIENSNSPVQQENIRLSCHFMNELWIRSNIDAVRQLVNVQV